MHACVSRLVCVWKKPLLAVDRVVGRRGLAEGGSHPVDELPRVFRLLVGQALLAFHQPAQVCAVLQVAPSAAVGQHASAAAGHGTGDARRAAMGEVFSEKAGFSLYALTLIAMLSVATDARRA